MSHFMYKFMHIPNLVTVGLIGCFSGTGGESNIGISISIIVQCTTDTISNEIWQETLRGEKTIAAGN